MTSRAVNPFTRQAIQSAVTARPNANAALAAAQSAYANLQFGAGRTSTQTPSPSASRSQVSIGGASYPSGRVEASDSFSVGGFSYPDVGADLDLGYDDRQRYQPPEDFNPEKFRRDIGTPSTIADWHNGPSVFQGIQDRTVEEQAVNSYNDEVRSLLEGGGLDPQDQLYFDRLSQDIDLDFQRAMEDAQANLAALERRRDDMLAIYGVKSPYLDAQIEREQERWQLQQQELKLRAEKAKANVAEAQRNQVLTVANRSAIAGAYDDYRAILDPLIQAAIGEAGGYFEQQRDGSLAIESNENEAIAGTYRQGVTETLDGLGYSGEPIDQAALSAALEISNFGKFELSELSQARARGDESVARAMEDFLVADATSFGASDRASMARRSAETDANFSVMEENALQAVRDALQAQELTTNDARLAELGFEGRMAGLQEDRQLMDLGIQQDLADVRANIGLLNQDQQRVYEDMVIARERMGEDRDMAESKALAELLNMDANGYGERTAEAYLETALEGYTPGRKQALAATVADFLDQNITSGAGAQAQLEALVVEGTISQAEASVIAGALDQYSNGASTWDAGDVQSTLRQPRQGITSADRAGGTVGQNPGGEAFNNIGNRDHPLYQQRAQFVAQNKQQIMDKFGLKDWGQWREVDAKVDGNRSSNSDHYSGGANDYYGSMDKMQAAANYLQNQPYVSFVRIHEPGPHLHVSYSLGAG